MKKDLEKFEKASVQFEDVLEIFPKHKRKEKIFGDWNLKEVLAHYSAWNIYFTKALDFLVSGNEPPYWESIKRFNKKEVIKRQGWSWKKVHDEFVRSGKDFVKVYSQLPKRYWNKPFWLKRSYTPLKFININIYHYQKTQFPQIKKVAAQFKR